jgi:hypothetical protein
MTGHVLPLGTRIRGLFAEAWARRRRRRAALLAAIAAAAAIVVLLAARDEPRAPVVQPAPVQALTLAQPPGMGVACPAAPNSIACDRIGIAAWLPGRRLPSRLVATVDGRSTILRNQTGACARGQARCARFFTGYLQHAGLLDGALRVTPDRGRYHWYGRRAVAGTLELRATYPDGHVAATTRRVELSPGWG